METRQQTAGRRPPAADFSSHRERMVAFQLRFRGIGDQRVLTAMRGVPREEFVAADGRVESRLRAMASQLQAERVEHREERVQTVEHTPDLPRDPRPPQPWQR